MENRTAILKEAEIFGARVVDSSVEGFALEATGDPEKLDEFIDVMRSYGEIEVDALGSDRSVARIKSCGSRRRFPPAQSYAITEEAPSQAAALSQSR